LARHFEALLIAKIDGGLTISVRLPTQFVATGWSPDDCQLKTDAFSAMLEAVPIQ
jgi:hypothetical protein